MKNIIKPQDLLKIIDNENVVVLDCRFNLMDKDYGKRCYDLEHIKNARRIDLENQLSSEVKEHGGRHPIPSVEKLVDTFENLGINNDSIVIAYDEGDLAGPSRLWWILKYLGHDKVYILDGGINAYKEIGGDVNNESLSVSRSEFIPNVNESMRVDMHYVKERLNDSEVAIIDSRETIRYIGEFEPVDKKAGHIPSALNYFWMDILEKENDVFKIKDIDKLESHFDELRKYKEIIVYCGSGVTACPNSLALSEIGLANKVYAGSFSDWISYDDNEIETK